MNCEAETFKELFQGGREGITKNDASTLYIYILYLSIIIVFLSVFILHTNSTQVVST
jgi:hypothetical protein